MSLAIIDLDGTLLEGDASSEKLFFRFLLAHRLLGRRQLGSFIYFFLRWFRVYGPMTAKKNKAYLAGLEVAAVAGAAEEFVASMPADRYCSEMVRRINSHHDAGDVTVLLTGSLEIIGRAVCNRFGIRHLLATRCAVANNTFTQDPPLVHPFGRQKVELGREIGRRLGCDLAAATAYGNDKYDIALLEAVARPVAVHPDKDLRRHALAGAWEIIEHSK